MTAQARRTPVSAEEGDCTTIEAARRLGLAVRSVQLMVDRGELQAWKTPGGHRRIARASIERWLEERRRGAGVRTALSHPRASASRAAQILLIEDSRHYQNLIRLLVAREFPDVELHVADDGIAGLAMAGRLQPDVLLVDILLPGIDGATLITGLRSHPDFRCSRLVVVTSLDEDALRAYAFALDGVPVVHKDLLARELPVHLRRALAAPAAAVAAAA